jgi:hypothetical protein
MSVNYDDIRSEFNEKMWELTELYDGWYKTFAAQLMDELFEALDNYVEDFEVYQIKEKFGELVVYYGWQDRDYTEQEKLELQEIDAVVENILVKYQLLSKNTCVKCGAKATRFSDGWVLPYCESCDFLKPAIMRW